MVKPTNSASKNQKKHGDTAKDVAGRTLKTKIKQLVYQVHAERKELVKEKFQRHHKNLEPLFSKIKSVISKKESSQMEKNVNILSLRIDNPLYKFNGFPEYMVEKDSINNVGIPSAKIIRIPHIKKLPLYTSWVYVGRNVRMVEDQSVIGKNQIYYDKKRGETVICSDNEEETINLEVKHDFTKAEDRILWMALEEYGFTEEILSIVKESIKATDSQIQERYEELKDKNMRSLGQHHEDCECKGYESNIGICLEKSFSVTLESFDNLFCRQCLIFDCPLHDTSQSLIYPSEKQPIYSELEGDRKPCSDQCYLLLKDLRNLSKNSATGSSQYRPMEEDSILPPGKSLNSMEVQACEMTCSLIWKPLERYLYLKGVEIFGKNSCLIAHKLLPGLKTCLDVARYMFAGGELIPIGSIPSSVIDTNEKLNAQCTDQNMPSKSRSLRKKGKPRKFTNFRKSTSLLPSWRRIAYGKSLSNKQYTPCGCHGTCRKECPCLLKETCCEKNCGCSKLCNNRFRGCYCSKSQCRTRLCPCFAANRECDPDICRNCWVSCGGGLQGEPTQLGDGQCGNMNLLLGQKERILLAKSNVVGWGAFAKNPINKHACLGEYTGELITPEESEKRGNLYDRINNSFLFTLNDQWVIDARRMGDKLKFANHSSKPNCYAKVMLVGGDHRVGIYAKENIEAGDEIFYDYCYNLDAAPLWALPKAEASKKK